MLVIIFLISRILLLLCSFVAQKTIPYSGFFPLKELLPTFLLPTWLSAFANFDGLHYVTIAKQGYSQYEQAFFPLYPLLLYLISFITRNELVSGIVISNGSLLTALFVFQKILSLKKIDIKQTTWFYILLLSFPTAFFFGAVYTEGLFFLLFSLSLYFLYKKNYYLASLFASLTSLTRLIGVFLIIPFFFHFLSEHKGKLKNFRLLALSFKPMLLSPLLGLLGYMTYLWISTGDPLIFFNSQPKFGANRSTHLIFLPQVFYRYIKIIFTAAHDSQWGIALVEVLIFTLVLSVICFDLYTLIKEVRKNYFLIGINIFSFANLILPTLTGTFSSIPRYALFSFSFFLFLAQIKSNTLKVGIALLFGVSQAILLGLFIQGYFVG